MEVVANSYMPGDPRLIDQIVYELKSQGIFDQFRKECISDVDTKPAYQNLRQRVEGSVTNFLKQQTWRPDMNKNQVREMLRKNIQELAYLEPGVERVVDQVVNPKINSVFLPQVEDVVYRFMGIEKPNRDNKKNPLKIITQNDLLPTDLEAVSPESNHSNHFGDSSMDHSMDQTNPDDSKVEEDESPPFEPLDGQETFPPHEENSVDSHMSGFSGLASHDSNHSVDMKSLQMDCSNQDSHISQNSSESRLSIITSEENTKMEICDESSQTKVTPSNNVDTNVVDSSDAVVSTTNEKKEDKERDGKERKENKNSSSSSHDKKSRSSDKYKSSKDKERDRKSSTSKDHSSSSSKDYKSRHSSSSSSRDKDKDKDKDKYKDKKDHRSSSSSNKDKDKSKTSSSSSSNRHSSSSSSKDKSSTSKSSSSSSSKDKDKSKSSSNHRDSHKSSGDKHKSFSSDRSKRDDRSSSSSKKDKEKDKDRKRDSRKSKDDHYSSKDKKSDRRSTDRDSNDGQSSKQSNSSAEQRSSQSQKGSQDSSGSNSGNGSGDSGNSDHPEQVRTLELYDSEVVIAAPKMKLYKPKFASNIYEARRLMKIRKKLARMEQQQQELGLSSVTEPVENEEESEEGEVELKSSTISQESFEALEARLLEEMSSINYDSYGYPDEDDLSPVKNGAITEVVQKSGNFSKRTVNEEPNVDKRKKSMAIKFIEPASPKEDSDENECRYLEANTPNNTEKLAELTNVINKMEDNIIKKTTRNNCHKRKLESKVSNREVPVLKKTRNNINNNNNKIMSTELLNNNFSLPLSPSSSEASDKKEDLASTPLKPKRNAAQKNMNQRYSSDDLYKPRPMFASSRRRAARKVD